MAADCILYWPFVSFQVNDQLQGLGDKEKTFLSWWAAKFTPDPKQSFETHCKDSLKPFRKVLPVCKVATLQVNYKIPLELPVIISILNIITESQNF